jgi:hypothetical protein
VASKISRNTAIVSKFCPQNCGLFVSQNDSNIATTEADQHASVGSLLSYLKEHDRSDAEDDMAIDGNVFTPRAVRRQMAIFVSESQQSHDADTLQWWKANEARFKSLSHSARKYLAIPATSAPSERVFSLAGSICNRRRACLSPDNLDALVF